MLLTPHAVTGATIGALVPYPALAIPLAIGSHYLLDMVPHWQETLPPYTPHKGTWIRAPIDLGLGIGLVRVIARSRGDRTATIWLAAAAALAPDLDSLAHAIPSSNESGTLVRRYLRWHVKIQRETPSLLGLLPQILLVLLCLDWTKRRR